MVEDAMECGARGISIGRNVFQAEDIIKITKELCRIVHKKY
jgi:DhnA family fructose-bisphosphate aldolase class Ia